MDYFVHYYDSDPFTDFLGTLIGPKFLYCCWLEANNLWLVLETVL